MSILTPMLAPVWTVEDIIRLVPELSQEQAENVMVKVRMEYRPEVGINNQVIRKAAEELYDEDYEEEEQTDSEFLLEIANKLLHVPCMYGLDSYHISRLGWIAKDLKEKEKF